jgi:CRISPR-associated endonuclease/helicase Cas3
MRSLVEQTAETARALCEAARDRFVARGHPSPGVHVLMGGSLDLDWEAAPERPAILVGTQDMLLSRALNRGYGASRYRWPVEFGLLSNDCLWVLDETQLQGVGVSTAAQLQGLRAKLGTIGPAHTLWMSATLGEEEIATVDHPTPAGGWVTHRLSERDEDDPLVRKRLTARKRLDPEPVLRLSRQRGDDAGGMAEAILQGHVPGSLTLAVLNRVERAQAVFHTLAERLASAATRLALVHSRFRPPERAEAERVLTGDGDRIVVATQAVEAGIDVSARTLLTELAPWPSLVQRFGRCNRYGERENARILWVDLDLDDSKADHHLPYEADELATARELLGTLPDGEAGPAALRAVSFAPTVPERAALRRRDLLDLFDTTPDLLGDDLDVSPLVRDAEDTDLRVYWRWFEGEEPPPDEAPPTREETCRVSRRGARDFLRALARRADRERARGGAADRFRAFAWDPLEEAWRPTRRALPGQTILLHADAGGYERELGWTGTVGSTTPPVPAETRSPGVEDAMDADHDTSLGRWIPLLEHLEDVKREAEELADALGLPTPLRRAITDAAAWHDVGKAHEEFQRRLLEPVRDDPELRPDGSGPWAKSNHRRRPPGGRPFFRHELASALSRRALDDGDAGLVSYLVAAHHGKVRLSIRSVPDEDRPPDPDRLFARGIWDGDELPPVTVPGPGALTAHRLDLTPMLMGSGSWLETTLALRDDPALGPFRLAQLEALVRVADWRASRKEEDRDGGA